MSYERLDVGYDYGAVGGAGFATDIVRTRSGREYTNRRWAEALGRWELGLRNNVQGQMKDYLRDFHRAHGGRERRFGFKDWSDYQANDQALAPTGAKTVQLIKTYTAGSLTDTRTIALPVQGTVSLARGGAPFAGWTLDHDTGLLTLTADQITPISAITQAVQAVITAAGHGRQVGDWIYLDAITGMTEANGLTVEVVGVAGDDLTVDLDTTGFTAYAGGGNLEVYVQPGEALAWTGEFDCLARFDTDEFPASFEAWTTAGGVWSIESLPVVEVRP